MVRRFEVFFDIRATDDIEYDIRAARFAHDLDVIFLAIINHAIRPQPAREIAACGRAVGGQHLHAEGLGELYRGGTDAAGATMHQQRLTAL